MQIKWSTELFYIGPATPSPQRSDTLCHVSHMNVAGTCASLINNLRRWKMFIFNVFTLTILDTYQGIFVCCLAVHRVTTTISLSLQLGTHFSFPSWFNKVKVGERLLSTEIDKVRLWTDSECFYNNTSVLCIASVCYREHFWSVRVHKGTPVPFCHLMIYIYIWREWLFSDLLCSDKSLDLTVSYIAQTWVLAWIPGK